MNTKSLITTGLITATVATGGWLLYESMKEGTSNDSMENVNANFKPAGNTSNQQEPVSASRPIAGKSKFLKRPVLNMSKAVSQGTLTSGKKLKRERERARRSRRYLEIGFTGEWNGLSPFTVNESIIAEANFSVSGVNVTGWIWIVTEFKKDGVQCSLAQLEDARVIGNQLSFRAADQAGTLEMGKRGEIVSGTWAGKNARLARISPKDFTSKDE